MKALIDGDILLYSMAGLTDDKTGEPLSWPLTVARLDGKIKQIVREAGALSYVVFVSGENNFRKSVATIRPYKGKRPPEKPLYYEKIKEYFRTTMNHPVTFSNGVEADDLLGIEQMIDFKKCGDDKDKCNTIICTRDKDLKMIPGWHYYWAHGKEKQKPRYFVDSTEAIKFFFQQLLTGDSVDNIPGLYNVGDTNAKKFLAKGEGINEWYNIVQEQYEKRFGSYWNMFMVENARLLWIHRQEGDNVTVLLHMLESERLQANQKVEY